MGLKTPKMVKKLQNVTKMELINEDIEVMMIWIERIMKLNIWYPVKCDKAIEIIKQIIDEGIFAGLEFNIDYTQIRKIGVF